VAEIGGPKGASALAPPLGPPKETLEGNDNCSKE
jgi:hypothetical protein